MAFVGEVVKTAEGKIEVKVPITYSMYDYVHMEFDSVEDMKAKLNDSEFVNNMPLGEDGQYLDDSYEVNLEMIETLDENLWEDK